ncbi:hypothetical protein P0W94_005117 [Escherichia coli]|nr:hypothetical protein [Escherichia coli]EFD4279589.1 hypothetical protein [Escherichia coli]EFF4929042.1 hypothetical protein [Escherichia coli]EFF6294453.1 hypothetical protein [Escherichia coli]EFI1639404.1 hypothetical protein [Escherichia coli]
MNMAHNGRQFFPLPQSEVAGPAFQVIKDSLTLGLNALTLTDVTKNAAYGVEIESLVLEINAPAA